jgi:hypothetical protein
MPVFDLEESVGVWFDFPGGGRVQLKSPSPSDMMRMRKASVELKPFLMNEKGDMPRVLNQEIMDIDKYSMLHADCSILAWEGFYDKNEKEIPCTIENKTFLMRMNNSTFRDFVNEKIKALDEAQMSKAEIEIKN